MKKGVSFLFKLHKITGTAISLFFLMWFVTGLVLLYHSYPRLPEDLNNEMKEELPSSLPSVRSIEERVGEPIKRLSVKEFQGQTLFTAKTADSTYVLNADTLEAVKPITFETVQAVARHWFYAPIIRVDTLHKREQWVLYSKYDELMPLYKFYFDDKEKHELFISGVNGEPQQLSTRSERFWAWVGAIPHKFYITPIRTDVDRWKKSISFVSSICLIAAISGWVLGFYLLANTYRRKHAIHNPYKKKWYRWHYFFGMLFGLFLIGWATSGIFSMQRIPKWIAPMEGNYFFSSSKFWGRNNPSLDSYQLDYRALKTAYPNLKEVEWTHFGKIPTYRIVEGSNERYIDASTHEVKILQIPESTIIDGVKKAHGEDVKMKISRMETYDNYYVRRLDLSLPVYKIEIDDADKTRYYVDPTTGYVRYLTKNKMIRKWMFNGIHYLDIDALRAHPLLWKGCLWILCSGCAIVCLTGVVLGVKTLLPRGSKKRELSEKQ